MANVSFETDMLQLVPKHILDYDDFKKIKLFKKTLKIIDLLDF